MLMLRNVLTIVWCRFGSWSLVMKSNFCPEFEHNVWSRFWSWSSGKILKLNFSLNLWLRLWKLFLVEILKHCLVKILKFKFSWRADISNIFGWSCCLVKIMKMKYDQDFFENLWNDLKKLLWYAELNLRVRCAFGNVYTIYYVTLLSSFPMYSFVSVSFPNLVPGVFFFIH